VAGGELVVYVIDVGNRGQIYNGYWGLKNKPCKCILPKRYTNTKIVAKQGNAEERPDAGYRIIRWKAAAEKPLFFIPSDILQRINLQGVWGTDSPP